MKQNNSKLLLSIVNNATTERHITDIILSCNDKTEKYGLVLNEQQALALSKTHHHALIETKRIELNCCIVDKLIIAFCNSPYITEINYEDTLHELIALFYELKNNTWDTIADDDLIDFLQYSFNNDCYGSIELLVGKAEKLSEHIHYGGTIDDFKAEEM